jgi:hypothetical protein
MSSKIIPEATPIILTADERGELESLVRSTKTEQCTHFKARIVLLAGGRGLDAGDCARGRLHDRHGVEMAGALRQGSRRGL